MGMQPAASSSRGPLSVEQMLKAKQAEREAAARPTFVSKAARERQAAEKRQVEEDEAAKRAAEVKRKREELDRAVKAVAQPVPPPSRNNERGFRGGIGSNRQDDRRRRDDGPPPAKRPFIKSEAAPPTKPDDRPLIDDEQLKARYLGVPVARKVPRKQSDRKFTFDWEAEEDTSTDRPVFTSTVAPRLTATVLDEDDEPLAGPSAGLVPRSGRNGAHDERHWSEKPLSMMKERDWRIFREDFNISTRGGKIPLPLRTWNESSIPQTILDVIDAAGYKEPSAIQRQAIPIGIQNRDCIGIAETGSGKTAAFVIPMLEFIGRLPPLTDANRHLGPYALVLAPTRELAQQIESETNKFTRGLGYRCVSIVGGKSVEDQQFSLRMGAEIIIGTPGRLKDTIERGIVVLSQCTYIVMDEADRMISLGFEDTLNFILDSLPTGNMKPDTDDAENAEKMRQVLTNAGQSGLFRQTFMFSATMPPAVERIAKTYMRRPAIVTIGVAGQAVDTVEQRAEFIANPNRKTPRLLEILNEGAFDPPIIVFVNTKAAADGLAKELQRARWATATLHSDKNQQQREAALQSLRDGNADILVATDLAGRGIDVPDVSLVMANSIEAYVHRIGRTGRAGKTGVAISFLSEVDDKEVLYGLKKAISESSISKVPKELAIHPDAQQPSSAPPPKVRRGAD